MKSCVVNSCKNYISKHKKIQGITYHAFPRHKSRRNEWVQIIRNSRGDSTWNPSSNSTICSAHFEEKDLKTTPKGHHWLAAYAVPKKFLSDSPETETTIPPKVSIKIERTSDDEQSQSLPSAVPSLSQVPSCTDEFALAGYCRLCASSTCDSSTVDVHSDNELKTLVVNMSNRLNTNIDFGEKPLPTTICSACVKSLYLAYDFVVGIDQAQFTLKKILMQKYNYNTPESLNNNTDISEASIQQVLPTIVSVKTEDEQLSPSSFNKTTPVPSLSPIVEVATCIKQPLPPETSPKFPCLPDPIQAFTTQSILMDKMAKKMKIIEKKNKNLKTLNQKVRRLERRNDSLKTIIFKLKRKSNSNTDLLDDWNDSSNETIVAADEADKCTYSDEDST